MVTRLNLNGKFNTGDLHYPTSCSISSLMLTLIQNELKDTDIKLIETNKQNGGQLET